MRHGGGGLSFSNGWYLTVIDMKSRRRTDERGERRRIYAAGEQKKVGHFDAIPAQIAA